jgi:cysteinyl-tRNA synthetase
MDDDFNAPKAIAALQEFTKEVNILLNSDAIVGLFTLNAIDSVYKECGGDVLGLIPEQDIVGSSDNRREAALIEMMIDMRKQARVNKDYAESDRIRDQLQELGVTLEDRPDGTVWRVK